MYKKEETSQSVKPLSFEDTFTTDLFRREMFFLRWTVPFLTCLSTSLCRLLWMWQPVIRRPTCLRRPTPRENKDGKGSFNVVFNDGFYHEGHPVLESKSSERSECCVIVEVARQRLHRKPMTEMSNSFVLFVLFCCCCCKGSFSFIYCGGIGRTGYLENFSVVVIRIPYSLQI